MKNILIFMVITLLPLSLSAVSPIDDPDLSAIYGQTSLNITVRTDNELNEKPVNSIMLSARLNKMGSSDVLYKSDEDIIEGEAEKREESRKIAAGYIYAYDLSDMKKSPILVMPSISRFKGSTEGCDSPYTYTIYSGDIEMRDTYINFQGYDVVPRSWVDIMPH